MSIYAPLVEHVHVSSVTMFASEQLFNKRIFELLREFAHLPNNWDEDGGIAPNSPTVRDVTDFVMKLTAYGQKVYHVAPGPNGEIMVDLRNGGNSLEIIFYPTKAVAVKFPALGSPSQEAFEDPNLPALMKWLNET